MRKNSGSIQFTAVVLAIVASISISGLSRPLQDNDRATAEKLLSEGQQLHKSAKAEALSAAIKKYEEALAIWRKLGNVEREAFTLIEIGSAYWGIEQTDQALKSYQQALQIRRDIGDQKGGVDALRRVADAYARLGKYQDSITSLNQALDIARGIGDREAEGRILHSLAVPYSAIGQGAKSLQSLEQAVAVFREIGLKEGVAASLQNLGEVARSLEQYTKALECLTEALKLCREMGDVRRESAILITLGVAQSNLGDNNKAIYYYEQSLVLARKMGDKRREQGALGEMALAYEYLQNFPKAIENYQSALSIARGMQARYEEAQIVHNLASAYSKAGDKQKALEGFLKALGLTRELGITIGECSTLSRLADVYLETDDLMKAEEYSTQSLSLSRKLGAQRQEMSSLLTKALIQRKLEHYGEAIGHILSATALIESIADGIPNLDSRAKFLSSFQFYFQIHNDLLMRMNQRSPSSEVVIAAFKAVEATRARSLLLLLSASRVNLSNGVDSNLLSRESELRRSLANKLQEQSRLTSSNQPVERLTALKSEIAQLSDEYDLIKGKILQASPGYAALTRPNPLGLADIQKQVLDSDSLLLEYSLGKDNSYLWAVTRDSVKSFELQSSDKIEAEARKVSDLLTARTNAIKGESPESAFKRYQQADKDYPAAAAKLSEMILGPVAAQLGKKRLLIVADGVLQYIPFAALPAPAATGQASPNAKPAKPPRPIFTPLIADHEIVNIPSATTLAVLRQQFGDRKPAPKAVAVLADPVFDKCDSRVSKQSPPGAKECAPSSTETVRAWRDLRGNDAPLFKRLKWTGEEAKAITALVPQNARQLSLDFEASRETATSEELRKYRFVHFATHGFLNPAHPELSGVVLSLVDKTGAEQNGFLRLQDVYNLKLSADLVVLSACETALGQQISGEGIIGLTRGFMYAGAPRVVSSLWKVGDLPSSELMKRFYAGMLGPKKLPASAALRQAQLSLWRGKTWNAPYYWAAFVLQGEYK